MIIKWVRLRTERNIRTSKLAAPIVLYFLAFLLIVASPPRFSSAAPPAPNWMPGFPLMAGQQVILMWSPVPGATKYIIYLNGEKMTESAAFQGTIPTPEKSGEYEVTVSAIDGSGTEGPKSQPGMIKIISLEPPKDLFSMISQDSIGIRWDRTEGAMIYNVYRAKDVNSEKKLIGSVQDTIFRDKEIVKGKE
jgi:hypothetical protein